MNNTEIKKIKLLNKLYDEKRYNDESINSRKFIRDLFEKKNYKLIIEVREILKSKPITFEVAYSYAEENRRNEAEELYEIILYSQGEQNNSAILNNLSNLKELKGKIKEAYNLIKKAKKIDPNNEIIDRNYEKLYGIVKEQEFIEKNYKDAVELIQKENSFVIGKLKNFLTNVKKETGFIDNRVPIPNWKFKVLMKTDEEKADSLKKQWIKKNYIRNTNERFDNFVLVYEINPYIENAIAGIQDKKISKKWIEGFENINLNSLEKIEYFEILSKIHKVNKKFKFLLERDFNELVFSYLIGNEKSVIVIAGSLIEAVLIYICDKKKIKKINYNLQGKEVSRNLYDCDLGDLLNYFEQNKIMSSLIVHLGNISRINRNFIHPGKEIRESEELDQSKVDLCFISSIEIIKKLN